MTKHKKIFLIDDSNVEALLLNHAIEESGKLIEIEAYTNSIEAFNILLNRLDNDKSLLPDLILLDLNMPGFNGVDFLIKLRDTDILNKLPTLVFTSSNLESDRIKCMEVGANSLLVKPSGISEYIELIKTIYKDWLTDKNEN